MNAIMMPATVPSRPIYGLIEPTLARNSRFWSRRSSARIHLPALAQAGEFAESRLENAFDAGHLVAGRGHLAKQAGKIGARPEAFLEIVGAFHRPAEHRHFAEDDHPRKERKHQQDHHDDLDEQAGVEHELQNIDTAVHALEFSGNR
jgi:hypothetical protein